MILYVGRVERIKGVHVLLEAVHDLPTDAKVVVCGGATEPGYEQELMQAGGNTLFLGRRSDIPELMAAADLLVMPSDWLETQGLVVHESMASGTPVVASDIGGLTASMGGFPQPAGQAGRSRRAVQSNRALLVMARRRPGFGGPMTTSGLPRICRLR